MRTINFFSILTLFSFTLIGSCNSRNDSVRGEFSESNSKESTSYVDSLLFGDRCFSDSIESILSGSRENLVNSLIGRIDSDKKISLLEARKKIEPTTSSLHYDEFYLGDKVLCLLDILFVNPELENAQLADKLCRSCVQGRVNNEGEKYSLEFLREMKISIEKWFSENKNHSSGQLKQKWIDHRNG